MTGISWTLILASALAGAVLAVVALAWLITCDELAGDDDDWPTGGAA